MEAVKGFLLEVQADFLNSLSTRVVVPLLPVEEVPTPSKMLNPIFLIGTDEVVMATQLLAAVPKAALRIRIGNLSDQHDKVVDAIDFLMQGL
jgi:toxin CcdB